MATTDSDEPKLPLELQFKIFIMSLESLDCRTGTHQGINITPLLPRDGTPDDEPDAWTLQRDQTLARAVQPALTRICRAWRDEALPLFYKKTSFFLSDSVSQGALLRVAHWLVAIGTSNTTSLPNNLHISGTLDETEVYVKKLHSMLPVELAREMRVLFRHGHAALESDNGFRENKCVLRVVFESTPLTSAKMEDGYEWRKVQQVMDQDWQEPPDCTCLPSIRSVSYVAEIYNEDFE